MFSTLSQEILKGVSIKRDQAKAILQSEDDRLLDLLHNAFRIRHKYWGKTVHLQLLKNAKSGNCTEDCHYCSQSSITAAPVVEYPLIPSQDLIRSADTARKINAKRFCSALSGMYLKDEEIDSLCHSFRQIKKNSPIDLCCSLGFVTRDQAKKLKEAGLDRVNHNLNSSRNFYPEICTTHTYEERIENIKRCKEAGLEICSGGILGQGESDEDILDFFFELKAIDPQSVPINFLIPQKGTPFEDRGKDLTPQKCLKILALARYMLPEKEIRLAAGREYHLKSLQPLALYCVNSLFVRGYLTSSGQFEDETMSMIRQAGFDMELEGAG